MYKAIFNNRNRVKKLTPAWQVLTLLTLTLTSACSVKQHHQEQALYSNVSMITESKLQAEYWLQKLPTPNKQLMTPEQISEFSRSQFESENYLTSPLSYPDTLPKNKVLKLIKAISKPSKYDRFYPDGTKLTESHYQPYLDKMALNSIADNVEVRFAVVANRTPMRMLPTLDRVLNREMDYDIDRFQETALFPGEAIAVLHQSADGEWLFVQNYHYRAWVQSKHIAFAKRETVAEFVKAEDFLVVTGDKVFTNFNPHDPTTSEIQLDMGVKLPLADRQTIDTHHVHGHNPYASFPVLLPTRNADGGLQVKVALVPRNADVNKGYLPMTSANIVRQAFKFLGERYGWGHDFNGRDCTGFIGEIYKSFGLLMPRNSGQQGKSEIGSNIRFKKNTPVADKMPTFYNLTVGQLLYLPGHVAMVLGYDDEQAFIIHDVHGMAYQDINGETVRGKLNGVSVTPLFPFKSYLKGIYNIKTIEAAQ